MSDSDQKNDDSLPLGGLERIDKVCSEFEKSWKSGTPTRIEELLDEFHGPVRDRLLQELLLLEFEYRRRDKDSVPFDEYRQRFPDDPEIVEAAIEQYSQEADQTILTPGQAVDTQLIPERIRYLGDYEILEEIARGGMGVVFKARQSTLGRIVAVKMMLSGQFSTDQQIARFEREAKLAGRLRHPNIVAVHEVGRHEGMPYFSMDFVDGHSLSEMVRDHPLPPRDAAGYVQVAAETVHKAHEQGILHRDLKPSNILIDREDQVRITDFGLAKVIDEGKSLTPTASGIGTPSYMPPEQVVGNKALIGVQSDVYSLGAVLYELLTGRPPFAAARPIETLHQVMTKEPVSPRVLNPDVPQDLETICLKCLEKEPHKRYGTAQELAEDLVRFIEGRPVAARPVSRATKTIRWCQRNTAVATLLLLVALSLLSGTSVSTYFAFEADRRAADAIAARDDARIAEGHALEAKDDADAARAEAELDRRKAEREAVRSEGLQLAAHSSSVLHEHPSLALALAVEAAQRHRSPLVDEALLAALDENFEHRSLVGHNSAVLIASFNATGTHVLTAQGARGNMPARIWDVATGEEVAALLGDRPIQRAVYGSRGTRILSSEMGGTSRVWDAVSAEPLFAKNTPGGRFDSTAFTSDDARVVLPAEEFTAQIHDATTGETKCVLKGHSGHVWFAGFSPDDRRVLTYSRDQTVRVWDATTGEQLVNLDWLVGRTVTYARSSDGDPILVEIKSAKFSHGGEMILTTSSDFVARLWDARTGQPVREFQYLDARWAEFSPDDERILFLKHEGVDVRSVADGQSLFRISDGVRIQEATYLPDGQSIVTGSDDGTVRIWSASTGRQLSVLSGQGASIRCLAVGPRGRMIVTGDVEGGIRLWLTSSGRDRFTLRTGNDASVIDVTRQGDRLAIESGFAPVTQVWNLETGRERTLPSLVGDLAPDGRRAVTRDGRIVDVTTGETTVSLEGRIALGAAAFDPLGRLVAGGDGDGGIRVWEADSGDEVARFDGHDDRVVDLEFDPTGKFVISASDDGTARIVEWETQKFHAVLDGRGDRLELARFAPSGTWAVTCGRDGKARIWETEDGSLRETLEDPIGIGEVEIADDGRLLTYREFSNPVVRVWNERGEPLHALVHEGPLNDARFTSDGKRILTAAEGEPVRLWDAESGEVVLELKDSAGVQSVDLDFEDERIVGAKAYELHVWDAVTGRQLDPLTTIGGGFREVRCSPAGPYVLTEATEHGVSIWDLQSLTRVGQLERGHGWQIWDLSFSPDGKKLVSAALDRTARIWDAFTGNQLAVLAGHSGRVQFAEFDDDGSHVLTAGDDGTVRLWEADTGRLVWTVLIAHRREPLPPGLPNLEPQQIPTPKALFPTGGQVVTALGSTAHVRDALNGREVHRLEHRASISVLRNGPNGTILTATSGRGEGEFDVRTWDAATGEELSRLGFRSGVRDALISPDGTEIITLTDRVEVWSAATGERRLDLSKRTKGAFRFAADEDFSSLLTMGPGDESHVWDLRSGRRQFEIKEEGGVWRAMFLPDGERILVLSSKGTVRLVPRDPLAAAIRRQPRELTEDERERFELAAPLTGNDGLSSQAHIEGK